MLLHEQGDELHLLPAVPDWWLDEGQTIRVERAPTHFGPVSFSVRGGLKEVEFSWEPPQRKPPRRVVLHVLESRPPMTLPAGVETMRRANQSRRWDFSAVLSEYEQIKPTRRARAEGCRMKDSRFSLREEVIV